MKRSHRKWQKYWNLPGKRIDFFHPGWYNNAVHWEEYSSGRRGVTRNLVGQGTGARVQIPSPPPTKKSLLSTDKRDFFEWCVPCGTRCALRAWCRPLVCDARLRRVNRTHRITYHSEAASLITCLQTSLICASERDSHFVRDVDLRSVMHAYARGRTHRITYHSIAASLIIYLQSPKAHKKTKQASAWLSNGSRFFIQLQQARWLPPSQRA